MEAPASAGLIRVGVSVLLFRDGKLLMGKRKGNKFPGFWQVPGGHLEFGENFEACARREAKEECGVDLTNVRFVTAINDVSADRKSHYVDIYMHADIQEGQEPRNAEPEKCDGWQWIPYDLLPGPLFPSFHGFLTLGYDPFKAHIKK